MAILQCFFPPTFYYYYLRTLTGKSCTIISFPPCKPLNILRTPHYFIENLKVQENKLKKFFSLLRKASVFMGSSLSILPLLLKSW